MTVTFTLTTSLTDAGPFNISGTTSGGALNGVSIATGITKQQLLTGHTVTNINDTITGGTIASTGTCTTTDTWSVTPSPTPTPTPTAIPTTSYTYRLGPSYTTATQACTNFGMDAYIEAFAATSEITEVQQFFIDSGLNTLYTGENETHAFARMDGFSQVGLVYSGRISFLGQVSDRTICQDQN
jgi:hypothetical protein